MLWVGTDDGNLQVSRDGGATWTSVAARVPGVPKGTYVSRVEASRSGRGRRVRGVRRPPRRRLRALPLPHRGLRPDLEAASPANLPAGRDAQRRPRAPEEPGRALRRHRARAVGELGPRRRLDGAARQDCRPCPSTTCRSTARRRPRRSGRTAAASASSTTRPRSSRCRRRAGNGPAPVRRAAAPRQYRVYEHKGNTGHKRSWRPTRPRGRSITYCARREAGREGRGEDHGDGRFGRRSSASSRDRSPRSGSTARAGTCAASRPSSPRKGRRRGSSARRAGRWCCPGPIR